MKEISHLGFCAVVVVGDASAEDAEIAETPEIDCLFLSLLKMVLTLVTYLPIPFFLPSGLSEPPGAESPGAEELMVVNYSRLDHSVWQR
jgi:hypothetical protein